MPLIAKTNWSDSCVREPRANNRTKSALSRRHIDDLSVEGGPVPWDLLTADEDQNPGEQRDDSADDAWNRQRSQCAKTSND